MLNALNCLLGALTSPKSMTETAPDMNASLIRSAGQMDLALSGAQARQLLAYLDLIQQWNKVYNLTAVRDRGDMLTHHLLDSLAVVTPLRRQLGAPAGRGSSVPAGSTRLLDVGSGAGLPGVVIAICCPEVAVTCVDTVAKKAAFIQQVAVALKLPNLRALHARVESLTGPFEIISSRAFASLPDFVNGSSAALAEGGCWLAMKGKNPAAEIAALPAEVDVFHVEQLQIPGLDAERCIVWMRRSAAATPVA
jgi:16S rRNA (guanine527-N7)-methyltransferase